MRINDVKSIFASCPKLTSIEIRVLRGLISGDGDIGGRMASSHPDARSPVDAERMKILEIFAKDHADLKTPLDWLDEIHGY